ncbi:MAG: flippase [Vicinamibacteria bacterium]
MTQAEQPAAPGAPSASRLARNTIFSAVGEGSNLLLFLLGFLAARWLAPLAFGQYSAAFAYVGLFRMLPDLGMSYASTLAISRDRSQALRLVSNLLGFQAVLSLLTLALCLSLGRVLFEGVTWTAVLLLSLDLVLKAVKSTLRWLLKSFERFGAEAVSLAAERVAILVLGIAALRGGYGVVGFVLVFALVRVVDTAGLALWVRARVLAVEPACDGALWWELLRRGLPYAYAGAAILMFFQVDQVMLERMRGAAEVGYYGAPVRVLEGLTLVPRVLGYALIPTMAALHPASPGTIAALYGRGSKYLLLVGLPIALFGLLMSEPFVLFVFGPEYGPSAAASRLLLPAAVFMFLSNFGETALACIDRWRTIVVVSTAALALNVGLNLLWIPHYGFEGAAWATLATEGTYFVLGAIALFAYGYRISWLRLSVRPLAAAAAFAAVLWLTRGLGLFPASALASLTWVVATFALGVWDQKEKDLAHSLVRRLLALGGAV